MESFTASARLNDEPSSEETSAGQTMHVISTETIAYQPGLPSLTPAELPNAQRLDQNLDDTNPDEAIQARPQWGCVSMLAAVQSLGGIVPGAGIIEAAHSNMFRAVEMHGLFSISNGGGSLQEYFLEQNGIVDDEGHKRDRDEDDNLSVLADIVADQREEQRREQEEWNHSTHELAGVEMTGEEWAQAATDLKKGGKGYQSVLDYLIKKGKTREQAERMADDMQLAAKGMSKPEANRTTEEKQAMERIAKNPEAAGAYKAYKEAQNSSFAPIAENTAVETRAGQMPSIDKRSDDLYADLREEPMRDAQPIMPRSSATTETTCQVGHGDVSGGSTASDATASANISVLGGAALFASAPNLIDHHQAALAALSPLDAAKPVQVASAPLPAANAGLDV